METVIVKDVSEPNERGWYTVELEDGRTPTTKNPEVAKAAFQSRGTEVPVKINEQTSGKFTNLYINEVDGIKDAPKRGASASRSTGSSAAPKDNERIARQWAYGRAVELLVASGTTFDFPLSSELMSAVAEQANALLNATKE